MGAQTSARRRGTHDGDLDTPARDMGDLGEHYIEDREGVGGIPQGEGEILAAARICRGERNENSWPRERERAMCI